MMSQEKGNPTIRNNTKMPDNKYSKSPQVSNSTVKTPNPNPNYKPPMGGK